MELTLDLSAFTPKQRYELLALVESFATPRYIPSADENAEHSAAPPTPRCGQPGCTNSKCYM